MYATSVTAVTELIHVNLSVLPSETDLAAIVMILVSTVVKSYTRTSDSRPNMAACVVSLLVWRMTIGGCYMYRRNWQNSIQNFNFSMIDVEHQYIKSNVYVASYGIAVR